MMDTDLIAVERKLDRVKRLLDAEVMIDVLSGLLVSKGIITEGELAGEIIIILSLLVMVEVVDATEVWVALLQYACQRHKLDTVGHLVRSGFGRLFLLYHVRLALVGVFYLDAVGFLHEDDELESINRIQTETFAKKRGVGIDILGFDVFEVEYFDNLVLKFQNQFFHCV